MSKFVSAKGWWVVRSGWVAPVAAFTGDGHMQPMIRNYPLHDDGSGALVRVEPDNLIHESDPEYHRRVAPILKRERKEQKRLAKFDKRSHRIAKKGEAAADKLSETLGTAYAHKILLLRRDVSSFVHGYADSKSEWQMGSVGSVGQKDVDSLPPYERAFYEESARIADEIKSKFDALSKELTILGEEWDKRFKAISSGEDKRAND